MVFGCRLIHVKPLRLYLQALVDVEGNHCCHFNRHWQITVYIFSALTGYWYLNVGDNHFCPCAYFCFLIRRQFWTNFLGRDGSWVVSCETLGCVRLSLFRHENACTNDKKSLLSGFRSYLSMKWLLIYHVSANVCKNVFSNYLKEKFNSYSAYSYSGIRSIEQNLCFIYEIKRNVLYLWAIISVWAIGWGTFQEMMFSGFWISHPIGWSLLANFSKSAKWFRYLFNSNFSVMSCMFINSWMRACAINELS